MLAQLSKNQLGEYTLEFNQRDSPPFQGGVPVGRGGFLYKKTNESILFILYFLNAKSLGDG